MLVRIVRRQIRDNMGNLIVIEEFFRGAEEMPFQVRRQIFQNI